MKLYRAKKQSKTTFCPICSSSNFIKYQTGNHKFNLFFCKTCLNGFTNPVPENIANYYPAFYWSPPGVTGYLIKFLMACFQRQRRRRQIIEKYLLNRDILDVGAGEGYFAKILKDKFMVTSLEAPFAKIKNKDIIKIDFLKWYPKQKFNAVVFWQSLEHVNNPVAYLNHAKQLLKQDGYIFIECPNFNCLESKIFNNNWHHLDLPRHLFHFTNNGLKTLLLQSGFQIIRQDNVLALDYSIIGMLFSLVKKLKIKHLEILDNRT